MDISLGESMIQMDLTDFEAPVGVIAEDHAAGQNYI
jgi:hypothetical protein